MSREYSDRIAAVVNAFLEEDDWKYDWDGDNGIFKMLFSTKKKFNTLKIYIMIKPEGISLRTVFPINADGEQILSVAEYLTRANYGLYLGNFEMDMDDGEISFKCSMDCSGTLPTNEQIKTMLLTSIFMFERYGDGLISVIFNIDSPANIIKRIEDDE